MNIKKLSLSIFCTAIVLGFSPNINAMKKEVEKKQVAQPEESSLKKALANTLNVGTTASKLVGGGVLLIFGLWIFESLPENHKLSGGAAGLAALGLGGTLGYWGYDDVKTAITINNKIKEEKLRELNKEN